MLCCQIVAANVVVTRAVIADVTGALFFLFAEFRVPVPVEIGAAGGKDHRRREFVKMTFHAGRFLRLRA